MPVTLKKKITAIGNSAGILLSKDIMGLLGVEVGDELELGIKDNSLILTPINSKNRAKKLTDSTDRVVKKRSKLLQRLT